MSQLEVLAADLAADIADLAEVRSIIASQADPARHLLAREYALSESIKNRSALLRFVETGERRSSTQKADRKKLSTR